MISATSGAGTFTGLGQFSNAVSGNDASQGLIRSTVKGPDFLTGGSFGVESSVLALGLCTTTGIVMLFAGEAKLCLL